MIRHKSPIFTAFFPKKVDFRNKTSIIEEKDASSEKTKQEIITL